MKLRKTKTRENRIFFCCVVSSPFLDENLVRIGFSKLPFLFKYNLNPVAKLIFGRFATASFVILSLDIPSEQTLKNIFSLHIVAKNLSKKSLKLHVPNLMANRMIKLRNKSMESSVIREISRCNKLSILKHASNSRRR